MILSLFLSTVLAAQVEFVDGKCKHSPVPNYISQTSLFDFSGDFPTALEVQEANEKAIRKLVVPKCAGISENACFALQAKTSVVDYIINTDIKQICSLTMLSAQYAKNPLVNPLLKSVSCVPPYKFPPVMRIPMPNPIGSGDHAGPLIFSRSW